MIAVDGKSCKKQQVTEDHLDMGMLAGIDYYVSYTFGIYDYIQRYLGVPECLTL